MKRLSLLLVLLVAGAAQGQTLHTCGSKPNQVPCLSVNSCVYSASTGKKYCGATMAAAEAQEMAHEPSRNILFNDGCLGHDAHGNTVPCPGDEALVCAISGVPEDVIIPYCDQVSGKDAGAECVQRAVKVEPKEGEAACPAGEHRSLIDIAEPPTHVACAGTGFKDCLDHHVIDVCEEDSKDIYKPLDDCDPGWVEKEHDKWGSHWVCEKDGP